jgi:hypothetical protein
MKWFSFSYYNRRKINKKSGTIIPKEDQKIVIRWSWNIPHIPLESIEYARSKNCFQFLFCGTENLYWVFSKWRDEKCKWFFKTRNDHCNCAG